MLPSNAQDRKDTPIYSGVLKYFPDAIAYVARVSKAGNDQHNPGKPLHWDRSKSIDHLDCLIRHAMEAGQVDGDGILHAGKVAWRALAYLQELLESHQEVAASTAASDGGWIPVDPMIPPNPPFQTLWSDGDVIEAQIGSFLGDWEWKCCSSDGLPFATHWRPSRES